MLENRPEKEQIEQDVAYALLLGMCVELIFKPKATSVTIAALDALSEMEVSNLIMIPALADMEKLSYCVINNEWKSKDEKHRKVIIKPLPGFNVKIFMAKVEPAINMVRVVDCV